MSPTPVERRRVMVWMTIAEMQSVVWRIFICTHTLCTFFGPFISKTGSVIAQIIPLSLTTALLALGICVMSFFTILKQRPLLIIVSCTCYALFAWYFMVVISPVFYWTKAMYFMFGFVSAVVAGAEIFSYREEHPR